MAPPPPPVPRVARWATIGMVAFGAVGAVAGLVLGLRAHPATAWFAVFELGIPAAVVGTVIGATAGTVAALIHRLVDGTGLEPPARPR